MVGKKVPALTRGGNPTRTWTSGFNALNQLVSVRYRLSSWPADSLIARYAYDVLGRRIAKRVYRTATGGVVGYRRFVYAGAQVSLETDSAGTVKMKYTWGADVDDLDGLTDSAGTTYYVVQDRLRSVRGLVKRDGTWAMSQRFAPYGARLARDSAGALPTLRYGWTGRELDGESGLYYFRARYYDPAQLRFTQEDPIGYAGGANLYAYAGGRVLGSRDPSGLAPDAEEAARRREHTRWCYPGECGYFDRGYDPLVGVVFGSLLPTKTTMITVIDASGVHHFEVPGRFTFADGSTTITAILPVGWGTGTSFEGTSTGIFFLGLSASLAGGTGLTLTVGMAHDYSTSEDAPFVTLGTVQGFEFSVAIIVGHSDNRNSFTEESRGGCIGYGLISGCEWHNPSGSTTAIGYGMEIGRWKSLPAAGGLQHVYTWAPDWVWTNQHNDFP